MRTEKIIIPGELTDLNSYISSLNSNRYKGNLVKQMDTRLCQISALKAKIEPFTAPVKITFHWYSKNSRKDIDNVAFAKKFILDGLVNAAVLENDSRKFVKGFQDAFYIDKDNPRTEVIIYEA